MKKNAIIKIIAAALLYVGSASAATITTYDAQKLVGTITSLNAEEVSLRTADGDLKIATMDMVSALIRPLPQLDGTGHAVRMRNRDMLFGTVTGGSEESLIFRSGMFDTITLPLGQIEKIWFELGEKRRNVTLTPAPGGQRDQMTLRNNDLLPGLVLNISEEAITFDCALGKVAIPFGRIRELSLAQVGRKYKEPESLLFIVVLADGSRIIGPDAELKDRNFTITSTLGVKFAFPFSRVSELHIKNGRLVHLSDMEPVSVVQTPMFDERPRAYRRDQTVGGGPIVMGGNSYAKGLGTHSRCELTYELGGRFSQFLSDVGISDGLEGGEAEVSILLDGKQVFPEAPGTLRVRSGESPKTLEIDVTGGEKLTIFVDFGENLHINDHVNWGNARVIR